MLSNGNERGQYSLAIFSNKRRFVMVFVKLEGTSQKVCHSLWGEGVDQKDDIVRHRGEGI